MDEHDERYCRFLAQRRTELLQRIAESASRVGRDANEVTLLAVSKTVGSKEVELAHQAGYDIFGENRPQELKSKVAAAQGDPSMDGVRFDMIGNLQRNKINQVLGNATLIHSVSHMQLAEAISTRAMARGERVDCLLEVNVSGEASKSGFDPAVVAEAADVVMGLEGLSLQGLMTMAPVTGGDDARRAFSGLRELADELRVRTGSALPVLSCGMSGDFSIAVEEGSTLVRLGRIVFDPSFGDLR